MKAVTIDGTWGVHGSTNLDARALNDNYELSLALSNPEAVRTFDTRIMIPTLLQSHQAGPGSLAQPNQTLLARLKDRGMSLVRRFL